MQHILDNIDAYKKMIRDRFLDVGPNNLNIDELINVHKLYVDSLVKLESTRKLKNDISKLNGKISKTNQSAQSAQPADHVDCNFNEPIDILKLVNGELTNLEKYSVESLRKIAKELNKILVKFELETNELLLQRDKFLNLIPNLIHPLVPISDSEEQNQIIKIYNAPNTINTSNMSNMSNSTNSNLLNQYELCQKLKIIEECSNVAGNRGYFLVNEGVRLNYALINYGLDFLQKKGYKLMYTPHFMKKDQIGQVCQLSEFSETLYGVDDSEFFLIATSEQPMTSYFSNTLNNNLPIKLCGVSTCYRKEAGKHGVDTLGIFRVHQFEKIEQFCVTDPDKSWEQMEEMIQTSQEFYESLGISYRVVNIVSKELNNAASMKYDLEGYFSGSKKYRELVSCTNTTDYFSRKIKVKNANRDFAHMLNSTLFANTRTICCILETHQCSDGVVVPEVLRKYYDCEKIYFKQ